MPGVSLGPGVGWEMFAVAAQFTYLGCEMGPVVMVEALGVRELPARKVRR